jgi:hypothetical protein
MYGIGTEVCEMPGFDSPKEWRELLKEEYGRFGTVMFHSLVMAVFSAALTMLAVFFYGVYVWIGKPIADAIKQSGVTVPQPSSWTDIAVGVAITVGVFGVGSFALVRWFKGWFSRWENVLIESLTEYLEESVMTRIAALERHTDITGTKKQFVQELMKRALEQPQKPDVRLRDPNN